MSGLYIHIPFCRSKCIYCDFYSVLDVSKMRDYVDAVCIELDKRIGELSEPIETVYMGGGTPSVLPAPLRRRIIEAISKYIDITSLKEFTVEANPDDVNSRFLDEILSEGINRVSIGIQTFNPSSLKFMNRRHTVECSRDVLSLLNSYGINYSADLIYGIPTESFSDWVTSLNELLSYQPPHLSAYLLSFEEGTRLNAMRIGGKIAELPDDRLIQQYSFLIEQCRHAGYEHYEISNFALKGFHAKHNSSYWNGVPYLGLGPGAHSFDGSVRRFNPSNLKNYIMNLTDGKEVCVIEEETENNRLNDLIITSLRTSQGLDMNVLAARFGLKYYDAVMRDAAPLVATGKLELNSDGNLVIPEAEWLVSDDIMRRLIQL